MTKDVVIHAEGLGKKYIIDHQAQRESYATLSDVLARSAHNAWRKTADMIRGRTLVSGDTTEEIWALKDVSFKVQRGEVLGIIGHNGAGKSTLLKILSRITAPSEGRVTVNGRIASLLEVGTGFHLELTGRENIYLNGAILGMSRSEIKRKFDEIVAFAELEKFLDTPVKRYSSGMYVRLGFAVAAHLEPEILVVDEVLAVGDAEFQKKCLGKLSEVASGGRTVVFVSHNMGAIGVLCPRTIYLRTGRIKSMGGTSDVIDTYLSNTFESDVDVQVDLQDLRIPGYGDQVMFHRLALKTESQKTIRFGHPIIYSLCVRSKVNAGEVSIGYTVFDASGSRIGTVITNPISVNAGEELNLTLVISNLYLAPGRYYTGFSIGRGGKTSRRQDLDIVVGQPWFQVVADSESQDVSYWDSRWWGNVVIRDAQLTIVSTHGFGTAMEEAKARSKNAPV